MAKTKTLTEILKRLGVNVQAARKPVQATRPALKAQPKISRTTGRKTKPDVKISTPTAGKGRKGVQATTPSIKAARPVLKAKPKISRTTGRKKSTAVVPAGSTAVTKQPSTALVPSGSRAVAGKPTPKPSRPMKRVYDNKPKALTGPKAATNNRLRNTILATIAATGAGTALMQDKDKAASAGTPSVRPKSKPASPGTPKVLPKSKPAKPSTAKTTEGGPGRQRSISAGPNTGFGPKGNIFPGSAKERAALMRIYGGTGSAAAKAAAAGKQGDMSQTARDALQAAKRERLSAATRKKGGKVGTKKSSVVARQVKGWGKARKR